MLMQEDTQLFLDCFGFFLRTGKAEQPVIRIADVMETPVGWVIGVLRGKRACNCIECPGFLHPSPFLQPLGSEHYACIVLMPVPSLAAVVGGEEVLFYKAVQFVQVEVEQQWRED